MTVFNLLAEHLLNQISSFHFIPKFLPINLGYMKLEIMVHGKM